MELSSISSKWASQSSIVGLQSSEIITFWKKSSIFRHNSEFLKSSIDQYLCQNIFFSEKTPNRQSSWEYAGSPCDDNSFEKAYDRPPYGMHMESWQKIPAQHFVLLVMSGTMIFFAVSIGFIANFGDYSPQSFCSRGNFSGKSRSNKLWGNWPFQV